MTNKENNKENNEEKVIKVERETFEMDGKSYYSYYIKGSIRGREVKIAIAPPDKENDVGGYTVMDIVYGNAKSAELKIKPFEIKDEKTRKVVKGNTYMIQTVDENGEVYECAVKPYRQSDKALLNMLLSKAA